MPKTSLRTRIEQRANGRCEYCHAPQSACGYRFHLEHIVPLTQNGTNALSNRALACAPCNLAKSDKTFGIDPKTGKPSRLFNPREQIWAEHFHWNLQHRTLVGDTPTGRATVAALDINSALRLPARQLWFAIGLLP